MTSHPYSGRISVSLLIALAAVAAALGLWAGNRWLTHPPGADLPPMRNALLYPQPRQVPEFKLFRADGQPLTPADWRGRWTIVFFGFTHCPDVCPTTMATFKDVWQRLKAQGLADRARFDFISVDPARDTPEILGRYVAFFDPDFVAATGSDEELTRLTRGLGMIYARGPLENGTYTVDHSASAVIVTPEGHVAGLFRPPFVAEAIVADLQALMDHVR